MYPLYITFYCPSSWQIPNLSIQAVLYSDEKSAVQMSSAIPNDQRHWCSSDFSGIPLNTNHSPLLCSASVSLSCRFYWVFRTSSSLTRRTDFWPVIVVGYRGVYSFSVNLFSFIHSKNYLVILICCWYPCHFSHA